jgi:hypothetical protein
MEADALKKAANVTARRNGQPTVRKQGWLSHETAGWPRMHVQLPKVSRDRC